MAVYTCTLQGCPNQYVDSVPRKRQYCTTHNNMELSGYHIVTCAEEGCEVSTRFLAGRGIRDGQWRCAAHGMSVILTCMGDDCTVTHKFERGDNIPDGFFCSEHGAEEARKLVDHMRSIPCIPPLARAPEPQVELDDIERACIEAAANICNTAEHDGTGNAYMLTSHPGSTIDEAAIKHRIFKEVKPIAEALVAKWVAENNLLALDKAACVVDIKHLNEMVDFALKALETIHSDPEAEGPGNFGSDSDLWVETVAKEAIDEIRRRRA